jgi:hypothetical protein
MAYIVTTDALGFVDLYLVDAGPGLLQPNSTTGTYGRWSYNGIEVQGYDPNLGGGSFVYARYSGTIAAGTVVEFSYAIASGTVTRSAVAWAGTANQGKQLGVAMSGGVAGNFGWFQVQGLAIATTTGSPVAGNPVYYGASAGVVRPTANNGAQMLNATYATAPSVVIGTGPAVTVGAGVQGTQTLSSTQAVIDVQRPFAQGAIL